MKLTVMTGALALLITISAHAQLSLLPQIGIERSKTSMQYNNASSFSPMGSQGDFRANLRMDYRFKKGHGPYVGIGTTPGTVAFSFTDAANAASNFKAAQNSLQWRLEGGYQYSFKPIKLGKSAKRETPKSNNRYSHERVSCGASAYRRHGREMSSAAHTIRQNNTLNLRLQPSVGIAYLPSTNDDVTISGANYQYNAGNYKTAVTAGMGFEFDKGKQRLFTLSLFYTNPLDQSNETTFSNAVNGKTVNNLVSSNTSSWGLMLGVPFSLSKNKKIVAPAKMHPAKQYRSKCESYRSRCIRRL